MPLLISLDNQVPAGTESGRVRLYSHLGAAPVGTVAIDPLAPEFEKSDMPPGGTSHDDMVYLDWANEFCERVNARWLDLHSGWGCELPRKAELVNRWQLTEHLYKTLIGWKFPSGTGPNQRHRIRFVAVQHMLRRIELKKEAIRYVIQLKDEAERSPTP